MKYGTCTGTNVPEMRMNTRNFHKNSFFKVTVFVSACQLLRIISKIGIHAPKFISISFKDSGHWQMLATEPHRKRPNRSQRPSATHNKRRWLICLVGSGLFFTCSLQFLFVHVLTKSHATTSGLEWWIENRTQILDESSNGSKLEEQLSAEIK